MEANEGVKKATSLLDVVFKKTDNWRFDKLLKLLKKIFGNIIRKPTVDKFRSVIFQIPKIPQHLHYTPNVPKFPYQTPASSTPHFLNLPNTKFY